MKRLSQLLLPQLLFLSVLPYSMEYPFDHFKQLFWKCPLTTLHQASLHSFVRAGRWRASLGAMPELLSNSQNIGANLF